MGYFPNGSAGMDYELRYCSRCAHGRDEDKPCAVWGIHLLYNYDQTKSESLETVLDMLIPRTDLDNDECRMFVEGGGEAEYQPPLFPW